MSLLNWNDRVEEKEAWLRDEEEPYSLPLVLRKEKNNVPTHEEALFATVNTIFALFKSDSLVEDRLWVDPVNLWLNGRIRKVARRARGSEWVKVVAQKPIIGVYGNAEVAVLPPHPAQDIPDVLRKLQVSSLDLERTVSVNTNKEVPRIDFAFNTETPMSTGKSMAQIGHAAQLLIMQLSDEAASFLQNSDINYSFVGWDEHKKWDVSVTDAGFTEVPPGTETVKCKLFLP